MADFEAEVYFYRTDEGGRRSAVFSGYRCQHDFHPQHPVGWNDASYQFVGTDLVEPGQLVRAMMYLAVPERNFGRLFVGMHFWAAEGNRVVASGRITKIVDERLIRTSG